MTYKLYTKDKWTGALEALSKTHQTFVPVRDGDFHNFHAMEEGKRPAFDFQNTRLSPKALVLPQSERLFECSLAGTAPDANILKESPKDYSPKAVVGIRPCDARALQLVKLNFDNPEYRDPWWVRRFESTTLVGLGCKEPCSSCFCTSVGGGPFSETGLDLLLYDLGDAFLAKAVTPKGKELLKLISGGDNPSDSVLKEAEELAASAFRKVPSAVPVDRLKEKVVTELFDAPFWHDISFACLNCGTCTYLCPTCWCFDIQDEVFGKAVDRIRNWDTCMSPLFTFHGSGHNPRGEKFRRVRQRFMHKLKYYVDKYDNGIQCTGCGRCVRYCPVNIDIRQVCEMMNNY
ncbi:MAG: 4Fe-4S dicluster domain-containing protein [Pseudomonadota bacterium]